MTNIFQERYYKINKTLLILVGGWPYVSLPVRNTVLTFAFCIAVSGVIPQIIAVSQVLDDWDIVVDSITPFAINVAFGIKLLNIAINAEKMQKILEHIRIDWLSLVGKSELRIMHEYAERGRQFTIVYATGVYAFTLLFLTKPVATKILQDLKLLNDSEPAKYPLLLNYYFFDTEANYYSVLPVTYLCTVIVTTGIAAADTLFIVQVQHGCAMFSILGHQFQRMVDKITDDWTICSRPVDDSAYTHISTCIRNHNKVLEFSNLLESVYSMALLSIVGMNTILISVTGYQSVMIMDEKPMDALRYIAATVALLVHLFFQSYFSQKLINHSEDVRHCLYEVEWYRATPCTQKLLTFILMRTLIPCRLTAGKLLVMSLESFTSVLKTSMSYFTLLRSMQ
uniref:Odorant receptor n=1 Tax=Campoletis chlorideae TaxID=219166 RepID=A0A346D412_9HYME|nr:odorant receptor [Campoletis chlorideae]